MTTAVNIEVLPKQHDFIASMDRELLYSGAFGAGKSRSICLKLVSRACVPGAREGLCRKNLVTLKATTLRTLLEPDGDLPPVLPKGSYIQNKSEKEIKIVGGGSIVYFGLDKLDKIGSYNLTGCGVDEAVELMERDYTQLRGRIRMKVDGLDNQLYSACNPGPPSHFLAERFGLADGHACKENCKAITTKTTDNWFLPKPYVDDLLTLTGLAKRRYVEGMWVGSEGLVYDNWDRSKFVQERQGPWNRIVIGQDEGYTNPAVLLLGGLDGDGRLHIISEWYKTKQVEDSVITEAKRLYQEWSPECFVVDPSAAKLRASMTQNGLPVAEANNDVFGGIQAVQGRLVVAGDGRPRLTVDPGCEQTIKEFETYEWMQSNDNIKDKPRKQFDHAMDALRYMVMHLDGGVPVTFRLIGGDSSDDTMNDESMWQ